MFKWTETKFGVFLVLKRRSADLSTGRDFCRQGCVASRVSAATISSTGAQVNTAYRC